ncbi:cyclic nucleotide-binding protein [Clostridium scatologenes]|uniref:Cyclic nucleotide-binding protein n=1 Tax=Clostridium scatologenes TaxID=1548 RepID=A0A0E3K0M8_CLOSL|nr:cyclic nucleotide-binding protein [Clostridium scatologenes]
MSIPTIYSSIKCFSPLREPSKIIYSTKILFFLLLFYHILIKFQI